MNKYDYVIKICSEEIKKLRKDIYTAGLGLDAELTAGFPTEVLQQFKKQIVELRSAAEVLRRAGSEEEIKMLRIRPDTGFAWLYVPFDKEQIWDGAISESEIGDSWEIEVIGMTKKELEALPEFEGW